MKRVIVDAKALCYRMFYADPQRDLVNDVRHAIEKIRARFEPCEVVLAWDGEGVNFRNDIYPEYKQGRKATPSAMKVAVVDVRRALGGVSVPHYEADDVMASFAKLATRSEPVVLVADDKDVCQCLRGEVTVLRFRDKDHRAYTQFSFFQEWGVPPNRLPDVIGLMGDSVDGIPGVPGIGKKTACGLIAACGSLEAAIDLLPVKPKLAALLAKHRDQAFLSRRLATLFDGLDVNAEVTT